MNHELPVAVWTTLLQQPTSTAEPGVSTDWMPGVLLVVIVCVVWFTVRGRQKDGQGSQGPTSE